MFIVYDFISFSFYMWYACINEFQYYIFQFDFLDENEFPLVHFISLLLDSIQEPENYRFVTSIPCCLGVPESIL